MSYILNISTAVPEHKIESNDLVRFYTQAFAAEGGNDFIKKLNLLNKKTKINSRYSCLPDYKGDAYVLYTDNNFKQPVEKRMELYRKKIMPLATDAIDRLFAQSDITPADITHLITVSCTGLMAPGLEFMIAEQYGLQHTEKSAINFLGCYAALKAIKQAHYIAQSNPQASVLIVCAELCSLHFYPSAEEEDIIANLLFSDGASSVVICGNKNKLAENKVVLQIDDIGTGFIPHTADLMTWNLSSTAFRMHLSPKVVESIKENIHEAVITFLGNHITETDYWAIHPGGVKIVEAVQEGLNLTDSNVADSMSILQQYGNMSSPTILFILDSIFNKIKANEQQSKNIFSCAFGPGLNIEMLRLSSVNTNTQQTTNHSNRNYVVEV
ncbi:MAG TPA: type III polyketide synthase [Bacteroidia bacterium]|nr:type III polyketide synthase [Bacteroidia bacterium]